MKMSELQYIGLAYNKTVLGPLDVWINAFLFEQHSGHDDDIMTENVEHQATVSGVDGNAYVANASFRKHIKAKWLPLGGNRFTAPTLQVGERVQIWKESDSGRYWWSNVGLDESLRKRETIIFGICANEKEGTGGREPENMYWFEISSHSRKISMKTSQHLGEKAAYEFYFDLAEGKVKLNDNIGNVLSLDSVEKIWKIINADQSYLEINKRNIRIDAPDNITINAGKQVTILSGTSTTVKAGTNVDVTSGSAMNLKAGATMNIGSNAGVIMTTPTFSGRSGQGG